ARYERQPAEEEELFPDEHGGQHVEGQARERDRVWREARLDQAVADQLATVAVADRGACAARWRAVAAPAQTSRRGVLSGRPRKGAPASSPSRAPRRRL